MFSKTLFLVVLCCAVVFVNAKPEPRRSLRVRRSPAVSDKVKDWYHNTTRKVDKFFDRVSNAFRTFWDRITGAESRRLRQQISELKAEYDLLKQQSADAVNEKKARWQREVEVQEERLQKLREEATQNLEAEEKKLRELKKVADRDVDAEINDWDRKFSNLEGRIEKVTN